MSKIHAAPLRLTEEGRRTHALRPAIKQKREDKILKQKMEEEKKKLKEDKKIKGA